MIIAMIIIVTIMMVETTTMMIMINLRYLIFEPLDFWIRVSLCMTSKTDIIAFCDVRLEARMSYLDLCNCCDPCKERKEKVEFNDTSIVFNISWRPGGSVSKVVSHLCARHIGVIIWGVHVYASAISTQDPNFAIMLADALAPNGARPSAGTVLRTN